MITAVHTLIYADDADRARAFFREVLGWPHIDAGGGWLIFRSGPSELAVHPGDAPQHQVTLMCDDLEQTVADLEAKGATFTGPVEDAGWGVTRMLAVPGAGELMLYQPRYEPAYDR
ncbi:MAG: VOC family protein [Thermocrispum sp.]